MKRVAEISIFLLVFSPVIALFLGGLFNYYWFTGAIFVVISVLFILQLIQEGKKVEFPAYLGWLCAAFVYYFIWAWEQDFRLHGGFHKFLYKNPTLFSIFVFMLVENLKFSRQYVSRIKLILVITVFVSLAVSLIQAFYNSDFMMPVGNENYYSEYGTDFGKVRFVSIYGWLAQNDYGLSFLPIVSILVGLSLVEKNRLPWLIVAVATVYVILSGARWIMAGFLVLFMQYFVFKKNSVITLLKYLGILILSVALAIKALELIGYDITLIVNRLQSKTYESRFLAFELFLEYFPAQPWLGTGMHVTKSLASELAGMSSQIHVGYLSHLLSYGIIGSTFLFAAWWSFTARLWRTAKKTRYFGSFFGFLTFLAANLTLVDYSIYYYGIVFLVVFSNYERDKREKTNIKTRSNMKIPAGIRLNLSSEKA